MKTTHDRRRPVKSLRQHQRHEPASSLSAMLLLQHHAGVCVTALLLCLTLSSTARQAPHPNTEVQASLESETRPPTHGGPAGAAAAVHITATAQEPPSHGLAAGGSSRRDKGRIRPPALEKSENKVPPGVIYNTRQETSGHGGGARAGDEATKQEKLTQRVRGNLGESRLCRS